MSSMGRKETVAKLISRSEERVQSIGRQLSYAQMQIEEISGKLAVLRGYSEEYRSRLDEALQSGIVASGSRNYLAFIGQLGRAIDMQQDTLTQHQKQLEMLREQWQIARSKKLVYETLQVRLESEEQCKALGRLQKQMDEYAQRARRMVLQLG